MRVTGGDFKNRKLFVPDGNHVRPTSDRMRQTLFNMLHHAKWLDGFQIDGANVLDLYCGTGALGIEALSHGAEHCVFVDRDIASVNQNTAFINDARYKIIKGNAVGLSRGHGNISLVFMDPPYRQDLIAPTVSNLIEKEWLADQAIIIIEAEKNLKLDVPLVALDRRSQSQSDLHVFRYHAAVDQDQ